MSENYRLTKSRVASQKDRLLVAQRDGWVIEHEVSSKRSGLRFKLTDTRAPALRLAEIGGADAPERRVWNLTYNQNIDYFGGDAGVLNDFYPSIDAWMSKEIRDYAFAAGLTVGKAGRKPSKTMETA